MNYEKVRVIGISGLKGSGKSEMCKAITNHLKDDKVIVINLPFAKRLKEILSKFVSDVLGIEKETADKYFYEPLFKEIPIDMFNASGRTLMQKFGTDFIRSINEDFWVDDVKRSILRNDGGRNFSSDKTIVYIVDDCRFLSELNMLRKIGATIIYVSDKSRPTWLLWLNILWKKANGIHSSEMPLVINKRKGELEYVNSGSLEDMRDWVKRYINK